MNRITFETMLDNEQRPIAYAVRGMIGADIPVGYSGTDFDHAFRELTFYVEAFDAVAVDYVTVNEPDWSEE